MKKADLKAGYLVKIDIFPKLQLLIPNNQGLQLVSIDKDEHMGYDWLVGIDMFDDELNYIPPTGFLKGGKIVEVYGFAIAGRFFEQDEDKRKLLWKRAV